MQPRKEWMNWSVLFIVMFALLMVAINMVPIGLCEEATCVDVKFEILSGLGTQDYFTGDHFWYNITTTNSGTTTINATFTVTVHNTTGGAFGEVESYERYLEPNDTTALYPNYTRLGKDEVFIYFMDTVGTYTIEVTSDIPLSFYRYSITGRYTVEHGRCHMSIDAMPSYQRLQNERWNQYLQENEDYMNRVQIYIAQSRVETDKTKVLAKMSVVVAGISIMVNVIALPKTRREEFKGLIAYFLIIVLAVMILLFLTL